MPRLRLIPALLSSFMAFGQGTGGASTNQASNGQLGIQLWLISDQRFYSDWEHPSAGIKIPSIKTISRGVPFNPIVLFTGSKADAEGRSNLTYRVLVTRPDGSVLYRTESLQCWVNLPAPGPGQIQLCSEQAGIVFGPKDPSGQYSIQVEVTDHLAGSTLLASHPMLLI